MNFSASVTGSIGGGGSIRTYEWDFGDGGSATTTGPSTSHRYVAAGTYVVRLRVVTTTGQQGFAEQTVRVTLLYAAPRRGRAYQSVYGVPSSAVRSDPLLTSNTPGSADGLAGSASAGTVCHESAESVIGSVGISRT